MVLMTPFSKLKSHVAQRSQKTHFNFIWQHFNILRYDLQFYFIPFLRQVTWALIAKCPNVKISLLQLILSGKQKGTKRATTVLADNPNKIILSQTNTHSFHLFPLSICSYIISKLHFKENVSTKTSETHFKLRGWRRRAEGDIERQRKKTVLALSV